LQGAAGITAVGAAVGSGVFRPLVAAAASPGIGLVEPIPTTVNFIGDVESHVLAPPTLFGPDSDPATVYNFQGNSAVAYINGTCNRRNRKTGVTDVGLPFIDADMRIMEGVFRGHDGHVRGATFALV
jgi:hypothetical protein